MKATPVPLLPAPPRSASGTMAATERGSMDHTKVGHERGSSDTVRCSRCSRTCDAPSSARPRYRHSSL